MKLFEGEVKGVMIEEEILVLWGFEQATLEVVKTATFTYTYRRCRTATPTYVYRRVYMYIVYAVVAWLIHTSMKKDDCPLSPVT